MARQKKMRIQDVCGLLNQLYPPFLAEDWDHVGLQAGDPLAEVSRVLICLDVEEKTVAAAVEEKAQLIIAHHPLIFRPLTRITPQDETGRTLFAALRQGVAIFCAHTNLDRASNGLNDWLATRLGMVNSLPLEHSAGQLLKLVVFVPQGHEEQVAAALFDAGAGHIGHYDHCAFHSSGTGQFRPGAATHPFIGQPGVDEKTAEIRLETVIPAALSARVVQKMCKAHPYEEVAFDLYSLANQRQDLGLGRIGHLPTPVVADDFFTQVKQQLAIDYLRVAGPQNRLIHKVAVCGGSGASLMSEALRQGADCLVTGDVKYHDAQRARSEGLTLIDAGHFATEILMVHPLTQVLTRAADERQWPVEFIQNKGEQDSFSWI